MKKLLFVFLSIYIVYCAALAGYFFTVDIQIPEHLIGTEADPLMYMQDEQVDLAKEYSSWRNFLYFVNIPFEWGIYIVVLTLGISSVFQRWSEGITKFKSIHSFLYVLLLSAFAWVVAFPLKYLSYSISKRFGISVQTFDSWMRDSLISFWVEVFILAIVAFAILFFIRKSPRKWWFYTWLVSIPFTLFLMFIQPVIIDPLYHEFTPIQDKQLEAEILALASQAEIDADRVYQVNMSEKTNALNAYVTGIGSNLRIVMWDTTLERLDKDEVLYVMAHEMGHYALHHLPLLLLGTIIASFVGLYVTGRLYQFFIRNFGKKANVRPGDLATLPLILLIFSTLSFMASPIENVISRYYEYQSDEYAIELTGDRDAAVSTLQKLATEGLSEVHPSNFVKIFRYTHPPMTERIMHIRNYESE